MTPWPTQIAEAAAGPTPDFIEITVRQSRWFGSAHGSLAGKEAHHE